VFTVSGVYVPSPGLVSLTVECIGGGGGGGAAQGTEVQIAVSGGGGGSGGYSRKTLPAALVAGGVNVTVGAGGAAGAGTALGGDGAATTFGALCVANGGGGAQGAGMGAGNAGFGGAEALPGSGDVAFAGAGGQNGLFQVFAATTGLNISGGIPGATFGGSSIAYAGTGLTAPGNPGWPGTGAGGSGGCVNQVLAGPVNGGAGASGLCTVTEYCWSAADVCAPQARVSGWYGDNFCG
jgi:hypothetical protein